MVPGVLQYGERCFIYFLASAKVLMKEWGSGRIAVLTHVICSSDLARFIVSARTERRTCRSARVLAPPPVYEPRHERVAMYK